MANTKIVARPWQPQDLIDDLQRIIDEECNNYLNTRRTTLCMARDYLKEHFAEQEWISVKDRLPEESGTYIVTANDGHAQRVSFVLWQKKNRMWNLTGARSYWRVTHWQPMPQPSKGE